MVHIRSVLSFGFLISSFLSFGRSGPPNPPALLPSCVAFNSCQCGVFNTALCFRFSSCRIMADFSGQSAGIVDALPYVDSGYDTPEVRDAVVALVEEEMKRYRASKDYLQHLPPLDLETFQTDIMKVEAKRMDDNKQMEKLDFKKYQQTKPAVNRRRDPVAWEECFSRVAILHSHMTNRLVNLQLQTEYGPEVWRRFIPGLDRQLKSVDTELKDIRARIQEINWNRKNTQLKAGAQLADLENSWVNLVAKNFEIERTCLELEARLTEWEKYSEAKKAAAVAEPVEEPVEDAAADPVEQAAAVVSEEMNVDVEPSELPVSDLSSSGAPTVEPSPPVALADETESRAEVS